MRATMSDQIPSDRRRQRRIPCQRASDPSDSPILAARLYPRLSESVRDARVRQGKDGAVPEKNVGSLFAGQMALRARAERAGRQDPRLGADPRPSASSGTGTATPLPFGRP